MVSILYWSEQCWVDIYKHARIHTHIYIYINKYIQCFFFQLTIGNSSCISIRRRWAKKKHNQANQWSMARWIGVLGAAVDRYCFRIGRYYGAHQVPNMHREYKMPARQKLLAILRCAITFPLELIPDLRWLNSMWCFTDCHYVVAMSRV